VEAKVLLAMFTEVVSSRMVDGGGWEELHSMASNFSGTVLARLLEAVRSPCQPFSC